MGAQTRNEGSAAMRRFRQYAAFLGSVVFGLSCLVGASPGQAQQVLKIAAGAPPTRPAPQQGRGGAEPGQLPRGGGEKKGGGPCLKKQGPPAGDQGTPP